MSIEKSNVFNRSGRIIHTQPTESIKIVSSKSRPSMKMEVHTRINKFRKVADERLKGRLDETAANVLHI